MYVFRISSVVPRDVVVMEERRMNACQAVFYIVSLLRYLCLLKKVLFLDERLKSTQRREESHRETC